MAVAALVRIIRLVPDIPGEDTLIASQCAHDAFNISFEPRIFARILQRLAAGALYPTGVMHSGARSSLLTQLRIRIPDRIKQDKDWFDLMLCSERKERVVASLQALFILLPLQIVQANPHCVHS